jgi:hypothetical protein
MHRSTLLTAALAATVLAACKPADTKTQAAAPPPPPPAPNVVTMTAIDYGYQGPDTIPAGMTTFRLVDQGKEPHQIQLIRLNEGKTMQDFTALPNNGPTPAWVVFVGGPSAADPGDTATATLSVEPGKYVMLCFIPSPDGKPHVAKGMIRPLEVVAAPGAVAAAPQADISLKLIDYGFTFSQPITSGHHTIKVENAGTQPHELVLVRLDPGKKAEDFIHWADKMTGPPPGHLMSGLAGITPGSTAYVSDDFTPGPYALVCFYPDAKDGKPHFMHGMIQTMTVS